MGRILLASIVLWCAACSGDDGPSCPGTPEPVADGDLDGHPEPLGVRTGEARAGRVRFADLPAVPSGLVTWAEGDFVLANEHVALVIEDAGDSDLYDPWGGRPVGLARVEGGRMVEPSNFGEVFLLTGRSTIVTESVTVISDGSDGGPAIVRARGKLHPLPFFDAITSSLFSEDWTDIEAAIDYELAPGAHHVDVRYRYASARGKDKEAPSVMHALMYTKRTPVFTPGTGFDDENLAGAPYLGLVDDRATSWAYLPADGNLGSSLAVSGFLGSFSDGFTMPGCGNLDRLHAQIVIGGPGLAGLVEAVGRMRAQPVRSVGGTVTKGGAPVAGAHVHATDKAGKYVTRAVTDATGAFVLFASETDDLKLEAFKFGEQVASVDAGTGQGPFDLVLPATGTIRVVATENGTAVPVRVQILPAAGQTIPSVPSHYGEERISGGRLHIAFSVTGDVSLAVPPGSWEVIVSRGYEYEVFRSTVNVVADGTAMVPVALDRSVDTTGEQCADFHIHTWRSNDSGDDATIKLAQAVADGLEMPVRSEHEYVADFSGEISDLGVQPFAAAFGSIELTSFEVWGHMGVFPLTPDATKVNGGAPRWQLFPTLDDPGQPLETLSPPRVFDDVRARPESPVVIINHPRGGANYFTHVGFDPANGLVDLEADWDTKFTLVEVFNDSGWLDNRTSNVADWFGLLRAGRKVFAVGSSDSHGYSGSPVGYPRTCIAVGTDDPRQLIASDVRDRLAAGQSTISGGIYLTAAIGNAGPGATVTGAGNPMTVDVVVRAATWIDVDTIEVVVDGVTVDTIPIMPGDTDPTDPTVRWRGAIPIQAAATGGFVVIAAYGDRTLEPVHPGRRPFGVTNPIFVAP